MLAEEFSDSGPVVHFSKLELVHFDLAENTFDELQRSVVRNQPNASNTLCRQPYRSSTGWCAIQMFGSGLLHDGSVVHTLSAVRTQSASLCWSTMQASGLDVHSSPEVHAAGSTVRSASASGVTMMSNGHVVTPTSSREDGHYMNNVTVGKVGDASPRD